MIKIHSTKSFPYTIHILLLFADGDGILIPVAVVINLNEIV